MKVAILSDIHGNLPALELVLKKIKRVDLVVSLGDVVDYGPWSNECVERLEGIKNCLKILGDHEIYALNGHYDGEKKLVRSFFRTFIKGFRQQKYLKAYRKGANLGKYKLQHKIKDLLLYPDSKITLDNNYIIGHSHWQFTIKNNGFILLNPGSVGQNREYINEINYLVLDLNKDKVEMKSIIYDVDLVLKEMKRQKYPQACLRYYLEKKRR